MRIVAIINIGNVHDEKPYDERKQPEKRMKLWRM